MSDITPILSLPLILPAQAQKHVTHNEALKLLDIVVQLAVQSRSLTLPPAAPNEGDCYIPAAGAVNAWAGKAGQVAAWWNGAWVFLVPRQGWAAWVIAEQMFVVWRGTGWSDGSDLVERFAQLGVNATPDATNRLSVSSPAVLLNHEGAGVQLKLNKAAVADTASLLFQTGFSGRAEIGLAGTDGLSFKVSADGTTFNTGLSFSATTGEASLPAGAVVTGSLTGTAVTQSATDTTEGRIPSVRASGGIFGLGGTNSPLLANIDDFALRAGVWRSDNVATTGTLPPGATVADAVLVLRPSGNQTTQILSLPNNGHTFIRKSNAATSWGPWRRLVESGNLLGTVSQSAGVPTGAVIERGSNANGDYVRFADGTQICTRTNLSAANASTALGSMFRSADIAWTFAASFAVVPVVTGAVDNPDCWIAVSVAPTTTSVSLRALAAVTKGTAMVVRAVAVGRWF